MKARMALVAAALTAALAGLVAPARADVSGINVTISATSLTVTGVESDPASCGLVIVEVADQPDGIVYRQWKYSSDGNWSVTFWDLAPGTTYAVRVEDNYCTPYAVPDPAFRQLYRFGDGDGESATRGPDRFGYCSVAGNTWPDGTLIVPGTFLNLVLGQPSWDAHYTGAYPAFYVEGEGITCQAPPVVSVASASPPLRADGGGNVTTDGFYVYVPMVKAAG